MRKPRDIDAELAALAQRTQALKTRKVFQLGELVIAAGADALDLEVVAGALLAAVATSETRQLAAWRQAGGRLSAGPPPCHGSPRP